ncbi:PREDICTED: heat shock 70 kDa protein 12A-like [Cyprinodon variegatus]|uniref:heat shock 70 kDa protein 12A-like n=1 Tax=Cyprinodon variegatus TaxID=28743 RepID=UPI0007427118|nr:PREDICTED: heat shock 70 kDa protein 12A-like [Cyprinodon variegatus]
MGDGFIIAIDFGTAFSGYAFNISARGEESDPRLKRWGKEYGLETPKTPTCILFNEDKTFLSFGYEAQMKFKDMRGEEAKKHYFFEDFKMTLYKKKLSDLKIKDASGKPLEALKVFSESLRFLKDDALKTISSNTGGWKFTPSDFTWVLTVPAIWDESAKQFMREAAEQAGIVTEGWEEKLLIALEPEAASIWCKKVPPDGFILKNRSRESLDESPGTRYIVVDCGDFLKDRPQIVRVGQNTSDIITLSTGSPQGILSPLLFTLMRHNCVPRFNTNHTVRFTDETTMVGFIRDDNNYRRLQSTTFFGVHITDTLIWTG